MGGRDSGSSDDRPDTRSDPATRCAYCEAVVDTGEWHPVAKDRSTDGTLSIHPFCSDACRDAWLEESDSELTDDSFPDAAADESVAKTTQGASADPAEEPVADTHDE